MGREEAEPARIALLRRSIVKKNRGLLSQYWALARHRAGGSFFEIVRSILDCNTLVWRTAPMIHTADVDVLKLKIHQLQIEHRDLDDVICQLAVSPAQDQLQLQRLKKRKLFLKDQIALLERQLTPDIPA